MDTRQDKNTFIKVLRHEISNRDKVRQFFNTTFQELLKRFDGKVYNKRFDSALNDALKAISPLMSATCELQSRNSYSNFPNNNIVQVVLSIRNSEYNYKDTESLYTNIVLVADDNYNLRISADYSRQEKYTKAWAENYDKETEERRGIISNYAKYLKAAAQMEKAVKAYNELPHRFRAHIDTHYLRIY